MRTVAFGSNAAASSGRPSVGSGCGCSLWSGPADEAPDAAVCPGFPVLCPEAQRLEGPGIGPFDCVPHGVSVGSALHPEF